MIASFKTVLALAVALPIAAQPPISVTRDGGLTPDSSEVSGRLVVYFVREGSGIAREPADAPFYSNPQPMLGLDVERWEGGQAISVGASADRFPPGGVTPGRYRVQAVLDRSQLRSSWRDEPGNMYSAVRDVRVPEPGEDAAPIELRLDRVVISEPPEPVDRVIYHALPSRLLSDARGRDVVMRVGVVQPVGLDFKQVREGRRYPVVYEVPGFGGTHESAARRAARFAEADPDSPLGRLARDAFWIVLDPEGPNGHHLFRDAPCNGPVGRALTEELIPLLESLYPVQAETEARLLRGHSSGGWSVVHLALTYPDVFAGAWSSAPDPLDFRAFQAVDIYDDASMYRDKAGEPIPSYTGLDGQVLMTIEQENAMESVIGPANTSAQQWDSWQAAFGGCDDDGRPMRLYDEQTGTIDRSVAELYRRSDLGEAVSRNPAEIGRLARQRVRVIVGEADEFDLDEGVRLFTERLGALSFEDEHGWFAFVPGATHGSILGTWASERLVQDMHEHLVRHGYADR
ncbi:MAG: alpha/beta hydrolase [Planctomycetota bacterium]